MIIPSSIAKCCLLALFIAGSTGSAIAQGGATTPVAPAGTLSPVRQLIRDAEDQRKKVAASAEAYKKADADLHKAKEAKTPPAGQLENAQKVFDTAKESYTAEVAKLQALTKRLDEAAAQNPGADGDAARAARDQSMQQMTQAIGTALCVAQPEICPFVGLLGALLGMFGSTEQQSEFLGTMESVALGKPLTADQITNIGKMLPNKFLNITPEMSNLLAAMQKSPSWDTVAPQVLAVATQALDNSGLDGAKAAAGLKAVFDAIKAGEKDPAKILEKLIGVLPNGQFPDEKSKEFCLEMIQSFNPPAGLIEAVKTIEVKE